MTCTHPVNVSDRFCAVCGAENPGYVKAAPRAAVAERSGMRPLGWVVIAWNVLMGLWIMWALVQARHNVCADATYQHACQTGANVGTGLAIMVILFVAAVGDVVLGVIFLVTNRR